MQFNKAIGFTFLLLNNVLAEENSTSPASGGFSNSTGGVISSNGTSGGESSNGTAGGNGTSSGNGTSGGSESSGVYSYKQSSLLTTCAAVVCIAGLL